MQRALVIPWWNQWGGISGVGTEEEKSFVTLDSLLNLSGSQFSIWTEGSKATPLRWEMFILLVAVMSRVKEWPAVVQARQQPC